MMEKEYDIKKHTEADVNTCIKYMTEYADFHGYPAKKNVTAHILELLQAEAEGKLVILPCKVGDTVYEIHNNTDACLDCAEFSNAYYDMESMCDAKDDDLRYWPELAEYPICDKQFFEVIEWRPSLDQIFNHREKFGKTIFLTREEAEEALKNMT